MDDFSGLDTLIFIDFIVKVYNYFAKNDEETSGEGK